MTETTCALAGNPNTGKSTVFNALTGLKQHTGNWAGKTVANARGKFEHNGRLFEIVDLPGTYSLVPKSIDEALASNFIKEGKASVYVVVLDSTALERSLILALQILSAQKNTIFVLNLTDEAERKGIKIDEKKLSSLLNVTVIKTCAKEKEGLVELKNAIYTHSINPKENDEGLLEEQPIEDYVKKAHDYFEAVTSQSSYGHEKFDKYILDKRSGIIIMLILLGGVFWLTVSGSNYPSELLALMFSHLYDFLLGFFNAINAPPLFIDIFLNGMYKTLSWVVAVMLPPMCIFFPLFTLMEDCGLLPRIAFNLDAYFKKACCHGKQSLTMCMGLGCNAAGVVSCRIIDSPRDRLVAILTNNFVPCNGRFPRPYKW